MPRTININAQSHLPISLIAQAVETFTENNQPVPRSTSSLIRTILELWVDHCGIPQIASQEEALDICSQVGIARPERLVISSQKELSSRDFQKSIPQKSSQSAEELEDALIKALEKST